MKTDTCTLVEELLPLYIEHAASQEASRVVEEHLKACETCCEAYRQLNTEFHISVEDITLPKQTLRYVNWIKLWYLLCPLLALLLKQLGFAEILRLYEGLLLLGSLCCPGQMGLILYKADLSGGTCSSCSSYPMDSKNYGRGNIFLLTF